MRATRVIIGVLWYLAGGAILLLGALLFMGRPLLEVIDGKDLIVFLGGALVVALTALTALHLEYQRPYPGSGTGARPVPPTKPVGGYFNWSSLAAVLGAAVATALTPPVSAQTSPASPARGSYDELLLDGDRDGIDVVLDHDHAGDHCESCHHASLPGERATPCSSCHSSMTGETDIFDHDLHAERLAGNQGCDDCHSSPDEERTRERVGRCGSCHGASGDHALWLMVPEGSEIGLGDGMAPSYVDALHGACIDCHREAQAELARCTTCHQRGAVAATPEEG